jgi:hypothetical protein
MYHVSQHQTSASTSWNGIPAAAAAASDSTEHVKQMQNSCRHARESEAHRMTMEATQGDCNEKLKLG